VWLVRSPARCTVQRRRSNTRSVLQLCVSGNDPATALDPEGVPDRNISAGLLLRRMVDAAEEDAL
jgi:hypothetical protein